ncbi:MAG: NUDIX domain-containing protein [Prolixibacteraceae bacterium]
MQTHPKNHYQYCPRCSAKGNFSIEHFSFTCTKCNFQFFLNSAAAVTALIFNDSGELLLTKRGVEPEKGKLDLPGGFIDPKESAEQAMMREIEEELDLCPDKISYFGSFPNEYLFSGTIVYTTDFVFKCQVSDFSKLKFRDDIMGLQFIHPSKIDISALPFQSVKNIIKQIQYESGNKK